MLCIPQSSSITGPSLSDCLVSYPGHSLWRSYPSAEVQSIYSTAPANWAIHRVNVKTVLFQIIQFSISTQSKSRNHGLVLFNPKIGPLSGATTLGPEWTWEQWQWRGTLYSPKLKQYWNLTIRLFSVIIRTLVRGGSYPSAEKQSVYSTALANWATSILTLLGCFWYGSRGWTFPPIIFNNFRIITVFFIIRWNVIENIRNLGGPNIMFVSLIA